MILLVNYPSRFERSPDGRWWTLNPASYDFWTRYLAEFDKVLIMARCIDVDRPAPHSVQANGKNVEFLALPNYRGALQYMFYLPQLSRRVRQHTARAAAFIVRAPSEMGSLLASQLSSEGNPFGVEVVGDPYDVFAPGGVHHPLRPVLRWWTSRELRRICVEACAAAYVTKHKLQERYPASPGTLTTHYSSIELPTAAFSLGPRNGPVSSGSTSIVTVGSLEQPYKGTDTLIECVGLLVSVGLNVRLRVIGDGRYRTVLEKRARQSGLQSIVEFVGKLPAGQAIRSELDAADLFALPSRTEGLPRAMIEAMARGLPCIGSDVGGIPELLLPADLVPADNPNALADKVREVVLDSDRMARMSVRNLEKAKEYRSDVLEARRNEFYRYVREHTEEWLRSHGPR
jgi:glycosyltransferase involved in cell wall biosynthesis